MSQEVKDFQRATANRILHIYKNLGHRRAVSYTHLTEDEWLNGKPSAKLMKLLNRYQMMVENGHKPGLWFRLQWAFSLGTKILTFLNRKATDVINSLESAYYFSRKTELEQELESIASALQSIDIQKSMKELRSSSLQLLKDKIAKRYNTGPVSYTHLILYGSGPINRLLDFET